jgi:hypothetical protein
MTTLGPVTWLFKSRPLELWCYFKSIRAAIVLFIWVKVLEIPFKIDPNSATSWEQHDAIMRLACMNPWDMVRIMLAYAQLQDDYNQVEAKIRAELNGKVDGTM